MSTSEQARPPLLDETWLSQVRADLVDAGGLLLCLDFDGTLAPIVENPDEATMTSGSSAFLSDLAADGAVTVAVVSGRGLQDLQSRVDVEGIHYAGNHGLEWSDGNGRHVASDAQATQPDLAMTVERLRETIGDVPGCRIEDKRLTATVHLRQIPDDHREAVVETVSDSVDSADGLRLSHGKEILEIRPDVPAGKDRAVDRLRECHPDRLPIFVGDDVTDEAGFLAVVDDGFGILVGDRADTAATRRVPDPSAVTMLLGWFVQLDMTSSEIDSL